ncbi:MAG TPA: hypothetical protein VIY52_19995 [Streptosporangiaceae bacterium]
MAEGITLVASSTSPAYTPTSSLVTIAQVKVREMTRRACLAVWAGPGLR